VERYEEWGTARISVWSTFVCDLYINDIDDCVAAKILKFASDTKIYTEL